MKPTLHVISGDATTTLGTAHYLWFDEAGQVQSKTRVITVTQNKDGTVVPIIEWWTTNTPTGEYLLLPAHYVHNPLRAKPAFLVLCEVRDLKDRVVPWNRRAPLRERSKVSFALDVWFGIGARLTCNTPEKVSRIMEAFLGVAIESGIMIHSATSFGFKLGPRGCDDPDPPSPLVVCDQFWMALWLLGQVAEQHESTVVVDPGLRYFVSTKSSREASKVARAIAEAMTSLDDPQVCITAPERSPTTIRGTKSDDPYVVAANVLDDITAAVGGQNRGPEKSRDSRRVDFGGQDNPNA